jgi:hypothetical protein
MMRTGYLRFFVKNYELNVSNPRQNGAYEQAYVRGLQCSYSAVEEARDTKDQIRALLDDKVFAMLARWTRKAKQEGKIALACSLHAHLAYLYKDVDAEELDSRIVFTILASQIFLTNHYRQACLSCQ